MVGSSSDGSLAFSHSPSVHAWQRYVTERSNVVIPFGNDLTKRVDPNETGNLRSTRRVMSTWENAFVQNTISLATIGESTSMKMQLSVCSSSTL